MANQIRNYKYVACRTWRHAWNDDDAQLTRDENGLKLVTYCLRCKVPKHAYVSRATGKLFTNWIIDYPDDYKFDVSGGEVPDLADWRKEWIRRKNGKK